MKKIFAAFFAVAIVITSLAMPSFAATTTKNLTADLDSSYGDTWFADVMYNGEIVGYGNTYYKKPFLFGDKKVSTEYQNYGLSRKLGSNLGVNITVYAYINVGSSTVNSDSFSWSSNDWRGGSSTGWIQADASTSRGSSVSAVGGYVKITNMNNYSSNTYNYKVTNK